MVENGTARLELVKWDPNIVWNLPTLPDVSKTRAAELREEALLWRHDFEKELAREKVVRARLLERKAISDSMDQVCTLTDILPLNPRWLGYLRGSKVGRFYKTQPVFCL